MCMPLLLLLIIIAEFAIFVDFGELGIRTINRALKSGHEIGTINRDLNSGLEIVTWNRDLK